MNFYLPHKRTKMSTLKIGLFGFGCVGTGLYQVLNQTNQLNARIHKIVAKNPHKTRSIQDVEILFDPNEILNDPEINVVVELINNSEEAYQLVKEALKRKKNVVTANKKLIAEHFAELIDLAKKNQVSLLYEAAVAGSIPIIRNLEEYYNNDTLSRIEGIVNGTTNYILTQANNGISYEDALQDAQEKGFAEADPTLDVDGFDAKFKLVLLLKHAFGLTIKPERLLNIGIRNLKLKDVQFANEKGWRIKLFAKAIKRDNGLIAFVAPQLITKDHSSFHVDDEFNAVLVQAAFADKQLFYGKGAGSFPTASAVLSDISALQYNYQYEYRKSASNILELEDDFSLKVYIGSEKTDTLNEIDFEEIDDIFIGKNYSYRIGNVKFQTIKNIDWNKRPDLSLLLLPEELIEQKTLKNSYTELNIQYN